MPVFQMNVERVTLFPKLQKERYCFYIFGVYFLVRRFNFRVPYKNVKTESYFSVHLSVTKLYLMIIVLDRNFIDDAFLLL